MDVTARRRARARVTVSAIGVVVAGLGGYVGFVAFVGSECGPCCGRPGAGGRHRVCGVLLTVLVSTVVDVPDASLRRVTDFCVSKRAAGGCRGRAALGGVRRDHRRRWDRGWWCRRVRQHRRTTFPARWGLGIGAIRAPSGQAVGGSGCGGWIERRDVQPACSIRIVYRIPGVATWCTDSGIFSPGSGEPDRCSPVWQPKHSPSEQRKPPGPSPPPPSCSPCCW